MGFWHQFGIFVGIIAIACAAVVGLLLLRATVRGAFHLIERILLPAERSVLQFLQDRAMARALRVDVEMIRVRRRIETATKPIETHSKSAPHY